MTGGVTFDASISLGNILTILAGGVVWVVTIALAWSKIGGRIDMLDLRVELVEKAVEKIAAAMELLAKNDTTIALMRQELTALQSSHAALHTTVEQLRRGEGWITARRTSVEGEYQRSPP